MNPLASDPALQPLLAHAQFVRGLARSLVLDENAADDIEQETWLAALRSAPKRDRTLRPWLATVVRNAAHRLFRTRARIRRREERAARPESSSAQTCQAPYVFLRGVVEAVLALEEPNRSAVLMRFYEGLAPREIARRQGVPVETVRGRIKRSLEQMRRRLDAQNAGNRRTWALGLVGLTGLDLPKAVAASAAVTATASSTAAGVALMTSTQIAVTSAVLALGAGLGVGYAVFDHETSESSAVTRPADDSRTETPLAGDGALASSGGLRGTADSPERLATLASENQALKEKLAAAVTKSTSLEAKVAAYERPLDPSAFRFAIGDAKTPIFDKADWPNLAGHMTELAKVLPDLAKDLSAGGGLSEPTKKAVMEHNMPLAVFAMGIAKEVGGTGPNGSYTHPAVIANLIRAALQAAGDPLTLAQEMSIRNLGDVWVEETTRQAKSFTDATPALAKTIAEVDAKLRFLTSVKTVLTERQRGILFHPSTEGRLGLDLLSPALVYMAHRPIEGGNREEVQARLVPTLLLNAGAKDVDAKPFEWVGRQWVDDVPFSLDPMSEHSTDLTFMHVDRIQAHARAEVAAIERIIGTGSLTEAQAGALRGVTTVLTPQIIAK